MDGSGIDGGWRLSLSPSHSVSSCLPSPTRGGLPPGIPCDHSGDKYLLSSYYVQGAREMVVGKRDTELPTLMELEASSRDRPYLISCDKCYLLPLGSGEAWLRMLNSEAQV